ELRETRAIDLLAADAVRHAALVDLLERGKLGLIDRDDHLAADLEGDLLSLAELLHRELSLAAIHRLERTGLVIDPRMEDARVVARLMGADFALLLENDHARLRQTFEEAKRGGKADDSAPDDRDVRSSHETLISPCCRCLCRSRARSCSRALREARMETRRSLARRCLMRPDAPSPARTPASKRRRTPRLRVPACCSAPILRD